MRFQDMKICLAVFIVAVFAVVLPTDAAASAPALKPADFYKDGVDVSKYLVSEKLDGIRAYWDCEKLISRQGNVFAAPHWFTDGFPPEPMDGELWAGRNSFEETSSIVRRKQPHSGWRKIKYMVFDLPGHGGEFQKRYKRLKEIIAKSESPYLGKVKQSGVRSVSKLMARLDGVTKAGGEGLMLQKKDSFYKTAVGGDLLKLKKFYDDEAIVVAHNPGKGKFK